MIERRYEAKRRAYIRLASHYLLRCHHQPETTVRVCEALNYFGAKINVSPLPGDILIDICARSLSKLQGRRLTTKMNMKRRKVLLRFMRRGNLWRRYELTTVGDFVVPVIYQQQAP